MPRVPIDYSKSFVYKLCCKDASVKAIYVGSSTNKVVRKNLHKTRCNNSKVKGHNYYVYQYIRANGGFDNWDLIIVDTFPECKTSDELITIEREYTEKLQAGLNSKRAITTDEEKAEYTAIYNELNREKINNHMKALYHKRKSEK